jgi:hypothetical protein
MKVEVNISDAAEYDLIAHFMAYRASARAPQGTPFPREWAFENRLARECIKGVLRILERGQTPMIDCSVVEAATGPAKEAGGQ